MKPILVKKIVDSTGQIVLQNNPLKMATALNEKASRDLTKILTGVVSEEGGTGKMARLGGYTVAGKTGTAQKVDPVTKKYDTKNYVGSFVGYVPTRDPSYVIYVVYDSPTPVHAGGVVSAPVFKSIASEALSYAGVSPDKGELAKVQDSGMESGSEGMAD